MKFKHFLLALPIMGLALFLAFCSKEPGTSTETLGDAPLVEDRSIGQTENMDNCLCGDIYQNEEPVSVLGTYHYPAIPITTAGCPSPENLKTRITFNASTNVLNRFRLVSSTGAVIHDTGFFLGQKIVTKCIPKDIQSLRVSAQFNGTYAVKDVWSVKFGECVGCGIDTGE
jgi:hypothetical protein